MINARVVLIAGGLGFFIAVLAGGIAGVRFGNLIIRAIIGGVVFAGLGAGISFLIEKFLPELFHGESDKTGGSERAEDVSGSGGVNIVLPEQNPLKEDIYEEDFGAAEENMVEEVSESTHEYTDGLEVEKMGGEETFDSSPVEQGEGLEEVDSMEALPDLGEFQDSFGSGSAISSEPIESGIPRGSSSEFSDGKDPAMIARAIQTALKKDQKG